MKLFPVYWKLKLYRKYSFLKMFFALMFSLGCAWLVWQTRNPNLNAAVILMIVGFCYTMRYHDRAEKVKRQSEMDSKDTLSL